MESNQFIYLVVAVAVLVAVAGFALWSRSKKKSTTFAPSEEKQTPAADVSAAPAKPAPEKAMARPDTALRRTRDAMAGALAAFWGGKPSLSPAQWDEIEEALLMADLGVSTSQKFLAQLKQKLASKESDSRSGSGALTSDDLVSIGRGLLGALDHGAPSLEGRPSPTVISIVGVNGVGKTTSVGKLANWYRRQGKTVLLGAADTFRAAATEQLRVWAQRSEAQFVSGREQGDPGAVVFDALTAAKARNIDVVLIDTAGRLHTKVNLMEELARVHRVMQKVIPDAPHEVWLVLDGNLGQNSVRQAKEFANVLPLSGVIVTKLDGSAKGGALFSITSDLNIPIRFLGLGESVDDLVPFQPEEFVKALVAPVTV
jgi:fused signal recognition particle receptor